MNSFSVKSVICFYLLVHFCEAIPHHGNDIAVAVNNKNTGNMICTIIADLKSNSRNETKEKERIWIKKKIACNILLNRDGEKKT